MSDLDTELAEAEAVATAAQPGPFETLLKTGFLLTAINFLTSFGHFGYQLYMKQALLSGEFGLFNATLSLVLMLTIPLAAASQAVTHFLARHHAAENHAQLGRMREACRKLLARVTWGLVLLAVVLIYPLTSYFNFPRATLTIVALGCVPVTLWGILGGVWCAGLSRFALFALLNFITMVVRFGSGVAMTQLYPYAEFAAAATILSGLVLAAPLFMPHPHIKSDVDGETYNPWDREFFLYLLAALCVGGATYFFTQFDVLIAQRHMMKWQLDTYVAAGLLGRAILWGSQPLLVIFFTQRSQHAKGTQHARVMICAYIALILIGAVFLSVARYPLAGLFGLKDSAQMLQMMGMFAYAMIPLGLLQGLGVYYLASRRLFECYVFGGLGILYALFLALTENLHGQILPSLMFGGGMAAVLILAALAVVRFGRTQP